MLPYLKIVIKRNAALVALVAATFSVDLFAIIGISPSFDEIIRRLLLHANDVSIYVVFALSFAEHLAVVGAYTPFSIAILFLMSSTYGDVNRALYVFLAIVMGQLTAHSLNLVIGYFVFKNVHCQKKIPFFGFFVAHVHPQTGAAATFLLGTQVCSLWQGFIWLLISLMFWSPVWGLVAYYGFINVVDEIGWSIIFYAYAFLIIVYDMIKYSRVRTGEIK